MDAKRIAFEIKCYGVTVAALHEERKEVFARKCYTTETDTMSILSDAQELMARGQTEFARQLINKAKFFLTEQHCENRMNEEILRGGRIVCQNNLTKGE
jgi:hypothetical protein